MQKNNGFILITTLIFLLIITMLMINLFAASGLESKMAANFQNKAVAELDAENNLTKAEGLIIKNSKSSQNSMPYSWQPWHDSLCPPNSDCYLITAHGAEHRVKCTLQAIYVLEFRAQADQRILRRHYQLSWWPQVC